MLLAIDIGNSNLVLGIFENQEWDKIWRIPTFINESSKVFFHNRISNLILEEDIRFNRISRVVISSVVPTLTPIIDRISREIFFEAEVLIVGPEVYANLPITILNPYQIGADLVANITAAHALYRANCIIIDFGTALTFTTVNEKGITQGVAIAPGLKTATSSLYQKTAQLPPEVPLEYPKSALGMNTIHAIQSGVLIGYVGLVTHMIRTIRKEVGEDYITIATGGLSKTLEPLQDLFDIHDPNLTLEGLRFISSFHSTH